MKVSEFAKEYGLTVQEILTELKSLKLKAKDGKQDLSAAAVAVLKSHLMKKNKKPLPKETIKSLEKKPAAKKQSSAKVAKPKPIKTTAKIIKKKAVLAVEPKKKTTKKIDRPKKTVKKKEDLSAKAQEVPKEKDQKIIIKQDEKITQETPPVILETKPSASVFQKTRPSSFHRPRSDKSFHRRPHHVTEKQTKKEDPGQVIESLPAGAHKEIEIVFPIAVKDLSFQLQQKPGIVLKVLMKQGVFATINQNLSEEIVHKISQDLNFSFIKAKTIEEQLLDFHQQEEKDPKLLKSRPPVVTFMGHVDHGKTSLLDRIRKSHITDEEHGGITQHMAAYSVRVARGAITFLDTPGHAAFTAMRARGAHITDLVILVVAADEGIMPQTDEAIDHARAAGAPIVVAINKIDKKNADIERVKKQLNERNLIPEDWGGKTIALGVSATTGENVDVLLEMILLEAELLELKANYEKSASGIVVEAHLSHGKGPVASVIVQQGTLKEGDLVVAGPYFGKIRAMFDDRQSPTTQASPATPVEILGLSGVPEAGEIFYVVSDEKRAKEISEKRFEQAKNKRLQSSQKITLEDLYSQIQQGKIKELNIILKADVQGSLEALKDSLEKLSTEEVKIKFIHCGIGHINAADVILAGVSNAIIVGFHVETNVKAKEELEKQEVDVRTYRIIYDAVDDMRKALSGLLEPKIKKVFLGRIEVRQVFKLSKSGMVAGCFVTKGRIHRKAKVTALRNGDEIFSGEMESLKRFKDDVREVKEGFECGITLKSYDQLQPGDILEAYELEKVERSL